MLFYKVISVTTVTFILSIGLTCPITAALFPLTATVTSKDQTVYAKWGRIVMEEAIRRYPNAQIIDYQYLGRKQTSSSTFQETFKLWLKEGSREWGVYVKIAVETETEKMSSLEFDEIGS